MAKEDEKKPTAADKGKGKAPVNTDADKSKDAKPDAEDTKGAVATTGGMFGLRDSCRGYRRRHALTTNHRGAQRRGPTAEERP
jgi:hypothetical protein